MSIAFQVLGSPTGDNALLVQVDSGQAVSRLLFDCGGGCLSSLRLAEVQSIDHLFFSHLHMDHVCGFDSFFRATYCRDSRPNCIWGPPRTAEILQHRLQGFLWNLQEGMPGTWRITDIHPDATVTTRFELAESFAVAHDDGSHARACVIWENDGLTVDALAMDHKTPSLAYVVREKASWNIDTGRLAALGLPAGPWLQQLKHPAGLSAAVEVDGKRYQLAELRDQLMVETPGGSVAYLTDFKLDDAALERLAGFLKGCRVIVCEGQYRHADLAQARKNYHLTTVQAAELAKRAGAEKLVLIHLSSRYDRPVWQEMLAEAGEVFPGVCFPKEWALISPSTPTGQGDLNGSG